MVSIDCGLGHEKSSQFETGVAASSTQGRIP
jgi:hypothetical protein